MVTQEHHRVPGTLIPSRATVTIDLIDQPVDQFQPDSLALIQLSPLLLVREILKIGHDHVREAGAADGC
jgi:hypothetical protein